MLQISCMYNKTTVDQVLILVAPHKLCVTYLMLQYQYLHIVFAQTSNSLPNHLIFLLPHICPAFSIKCHDQLCQKLSLNYFIVY